ncbi:MAG: hypothetical protein LBD74_04955, partial [Spirochaetaceae bacterium]|nr:hypothetical protein [Spirochaetaceae bacterium]
DRDEVLYSYAAAYAFGAYLTRNYGGTEFIKAVMTNNATNIPSLNQALQARGASFAQGLSAYGQAFIFSGVHAPGRRSFNHTVTQGAYTFTGFDLWAIPNPAQGVGPLPKDYTGPLILDGAAPRHPMPGYSVHLQSIQAWQQVSTDTIRIRIEKPANPAVELYLMVR